MRRAVNIDVVVLSFMLFVSSCSSFSAFDDAVAQGRSPAAPYLRAPEN
jgi:hypothetical protein